MPEHIERQAETDLKLMTTFHTDVLFYDDPFWPPLLNEIYDPPYALFYRGSAAILSAPCAAVVGTRRPTGRGMRSAKQLGFELAQAGFTVVSGLALGIDACAHAGAVGGGKTAAVLGSGADTVTPVSNKRLAEAILNSGGCIISEYAPGTGAEKWHFPQRNRIISALSLVTVIVEAPAGSGALITADFALEQNRELCFHSCALDYTEGPAVNLLRTKKQMRQVSNYIADGACVVSDARDVIAQLTAERSEKKETGLRL
ncbi:DNA-protecting protein DprA [Treponema sp. OMZ 840]